MKIFSAALGAVIALISLPACGPTSRSDQSDAAASSAEDAPPGLLVVVLGGFTSCSTQILQGRVVETSTMAPLASALRIHGPFHFLMSCFRSDGIIRTLTSDDLNDRLTTNVDDVVAQITALRSRHGQPPLLVVGHSYGGWLAMKTTLALAERMTIQRLFTLDPISFVNCTPARPAQCQTAPSDITPVQRQRIAAHTDRWFNYFQTQTTLLHSSAIPNANENVQLATDHVSLHSAPLIWRQLQTEATVLTP